MRRHVFVIERGSPRDLGRSPAQGNLPLHSTYPLCRLVFCPQRGSFTLLRSAQSPGLKASHLPPHQAHCFPSPFCKVQTLRVVEAGKEITTAERFVFSKCAVSTWDPCCSTVTNQRQSRSGHGPLSVTPVPGPDSNFTVFRAPLPEVHRAVGTDVCWGDISDMDGRI